MSHRPTPTERRAGLCLDHSTDLPCPECDPPTERTTMETQTTLEFACVTNRPKDQPLDEAAYGPRWLTLDEALQEADRLAESDQMAGRVIEVVEIEHTVRHGIARTIERVPARG